MAFNLDNLADVLRGRGLKVVETAGWINRGYAGQDLQGVRGVMWHHTATNRSAFFKSNAPTLTMCTHGRGSPGTPDYLPGPLANVVFGRDGTCYIVATGVANHAGSGSAPGIPVNMGNHWTIGIEMESSGIAPFDWTPEQLAEAPKLGAALELAYMQNLPAEQRLQIAHAEYSDAGKIDPAGWPGGMGGLRAAINAQITAWGSVRPQGSKPALIDEPAPVPSLPEGPEVKYIRLYPTPKTRTLGKNREWFLKEESPNFNHPVDENYARLGVGHYGIDLFVNGSGLVAGETVTVQFWLVRDGVRSGYFKQEIHGSADGEFSGAARFSAPVDGVLVQASVKASADGVKLTSYGAEVIQRSL